MKKYSYIILTLFVFVSCADDNNINSIDKLQNQQGNYNFIYTVLLKNDSKDSVLRQAYIIQDGKVIVEKFTNYNNQAYNHLSTFVYDNDGRVIKEIRENQIFNEIIWNNNSAKVFNKDNTLIGEFQFNSTMQLLSYNDGTITRFFNYDSNENVASIETESGKYVEFLDYNISIINPLSLINSISVLRIDSKPNFKNVFKTEKVYPFEGDDYSVPLTFYEYSWTLNSDDQIETMTDEKTLIYESKFEYK